MYRVKRGGRNAVSFFSEERSHARRMQDALRQQLTMEAELIHALADGHLFLEYQPVFDTCSGKMRAVEALIRWRRRNGEIVQAPTCSFRSPKRAP